MNLVLNIDLARLRECLGGVSQTEFGKMLNPPISLRTVQRIEKNYQDNISESHEVQILGMLLNSYDVYYKSDLLDIKKEQKQLRKDFEILHKKLLMIENDRIT